jgi:site-specific DNA-methyltransferase (adenine-specific)
MNREITSIVYNKDCLVDLVNYPDNHFDLAIVDPPYGIASNPSKHGGSGAGKLKNRKLNQSAKKFKSWDIVPSKEYFDELFRVSKNQIIWGGNYFNLPPTRCVIAWDKVQPFPNFSQIEMAWTSFDKPAKLFKYDNRTGGKIHPTQKPIELYTFCLNHFANEGDLILDTHLGSGSSRIACHLNDYNFCGYEIDEEYYNIAERRFRPYQNQQKMIF